MTYFFHITKFNFLPRIHANTGRFQFVKQRGDGLPARSDQVGNFFMRQVIGNIDLVFTYKTGIYRIFQWLSDQKNHPDPEYPSLSCLPPHPGSPAGYARIL